MRQPINKRVKSIIDKINDVTVEADGTVVHNVFKAKEGEQRRFKDAGTFKRW